MMMLQDWEGVAQERARSWEKEIQQRQLLAQLPLRGLAALDRQHPRLARHLVDALGITGDTERVQARRIGYRLIPYPVNRLGHRRSGVLNRCIDRCIE